MVAGGVISDSSQPSTRLRCEIIISVSCCLLHNLVLCLWIDYNCAQLPQAVGGRGLGSREPRPPPFGLSPKAAIHLMFFALLVMSVIVIVIWSC
jgi:hypothetical protein